MDIQQLRNLVRTVAFVLVIALIAVACADDQAGDVGDADVSQAPGTIGDPNFGVLIDEFSTGFGTVGIEEQRTLQGLAENGVSCDDVAGPRATPRPSQVEVEIVTVQEGCLAFSYDVANFRSFVEDLRSFRAQADVIAVSPLLLEYRLDQDAETEFVDDPAPAAWPIELASNWDLRVPEAAPTGAGVTIAVIDSGIDRDHPSLINATITRAPDSGEGDYAPGGHGTIAAAIIAGQIGDAPRALAPDARILDVPADLCGEDQCGCVQCSSMTPAEAIRWSVDNDADILSMSFGYVPSPKPAWWELLLNEGELEAAMDTIEVALVYAEINGVAMTAAAGNCAAGKSQRCATADQFEIPAGHEHVIGVGALTFDDQGQPNRAGYSTRQPYVEIAAPGEVRLLDAEGSPYTKRGTSYATPFVSASLAVLVGEDGPLADYDDRNEVARQLLAGSALDLDPAGRDEGVGHGVLQLELAVDGARNWALANPIEADTEPADS